MVKIRFVQIDDARAILDIYTPYILETHISFETEVPDLILFEKRVVSYGNMYPFLVCYIDNTLAGYVYASSHRERAGYQWSCECSVYMHPLYTAKGLALILYEALFSVLKLQGIRNIYAGIALPNLASVKLHEKAGFKHFATYGKIGYKMGKWIDVGWWHLATGNAFNQPEPFRPVNEIDRLACQEILNKAAEAINIKLKKAD